MRRKKTGNPFVDDSDYMGAITVGQLVELVKSKKGEFPMGLDTVIRIGDVEGNMGVNGDVCLTWHKPGDVVLSIDPNAGDQTYGDEPSSDRFERFRAAVVDVFGDDFVGFCDSRSGRRPQFGFATNEPDRGPNVAGKYIDRVMDEIRKAGYKHVACMPFPIHGRLVYVCSGSELAE